MVLINGEGKRKPVATVERCVIACAHLGEFIVVVVRLRERHRGRRHSKLAVDAQHTPQRSVSGLSWSMKTSD